VIDLAREAATAALNALHEKGCHLSDEAIATLAGALVIGTAISSAIREASKLLDARLDWMSMQDDARLTRNIKAMNDADELLYRGKTT